MFWPFFCFGLSKTLFLFFVRVVRLILDGLACFGPLFDRPVLFLGIATPQWRFA
jgi:hypothetical protein